ncbi:hypothetical protein M1M34_gp071 [Haloarcula tailed virus 2]|uniref:Uncharacterized protein n=1 Tax=Haloarcula tailed virus 2 TaxID=2877989 RepID=A0AAE8XZM6_9CAUD|nr:hypothetical protein M1M34_gp071 [Haloarcula tailed virus 2]UBF23262.1 hypothetical protein HATV-2_gp111 [Haloarcula tailed virus 2]
MQNYYVEVVDSHHAYLPEGHTLLVTEEHSDGRLSVRTTPTGTDFPNVFDLTPTDTEGVYKASEGRRHDYITFTEKVY